jgi:hypothetical protein
MQSPERNSKSTMENGAPSRTLSVLRFCFSCPGMAHGAPADVARPQTKTPLLTPLPKDDDRCFESIFRLNRQRQSAS